MSRTTRWLVTWAACLGATLLQSSAAWATRPGFNGSIAYVQDSAIFVDDRQLSHPPENNFDENPAWSPDGKQLAFVRSRNAIYVMNADGSNVRRLVGSGDTGDSPRGYLSSLAWTANGAYVTFFAAQNGTGPYIRWSVLVSQPHATLSGASQRMGEPQRDILEREKEVYACAQFKPELCILDGGETRLDLTDALPRDNQTGTLPELSAPNWQPTKIAGRPRILVSVSGYPDGSAPARREIYSIDPRYHYDPRTGTGTYQFDPQRLTVSDVIGCGAIGATPTPMPATEYFNPVSSPDGEFFAAEKLTRIGDCTTTRELYRFKKDGNEIEQLGSKASQPAWQPKQAQFAVNVTTFVDDPIDGAEVSVRVDDAAGSAVPGLTTDTASGGGYLFNGLSPGNYRVRVTLRNPAFEIHHDYPSSEPVWVEKKISIKGNLASNTPFNFVFKDEDVAGSSFGTGPVEDLEGMAEIFRDLHHYVQWVKANVTADTGARVTYYTFATTDGAGGPVKPGAAFYNRASQAVWIGTDESSTAARAGGFVSTFNAPENSEWHEFNHHLYYFDCPGEGNHDGYRNGSTCDSLSEAVPAFLAAWANHGSDSMYAGFLDLEWQTKAWGGRYTGNSPPYSDAPLRNDDNPFMFSNEDLAIAALLWDIVDSAVDVEYTTAVTKALTGTPTHIPVTYRDTVSIPLSSLWSILTSSGAQTVRDLRRALDVLPEFSQRTIDLDHDGQMDVSAGDELFLMHGFFDIYDDQVIEGNHRSYHYYIPTEEEGRNLYVGRSSHLAYNFNSFSSPQIIPRHQLPVARNGNLRVEVRDASGTPLEDADLTLSVQYPGWTQTVKLKVSDGAGTLVPFGLPTYFDYIPSGTTLPACNLDTDVYVSVIARASVNGYAAANVPAFDNCQFTRALFAGMGNSALSIAFQFAEDSVPPQAMRDVSTLGGNVLGDRPNVVLEGAWAVKLTCSDPVVGGFASGCLPIEYRLDEGAWIKYGGEFAIREAGLHRLETRAKDRAGNLASLDAIELGVIPSFDPVPPVTTLTAVASVPPVDGYTSGVWHITLDCVDHGNPNGSGVENTPSGCVKTEYSIDGAAFVVYHGAFDVTGAGEHTVAYRSIDLMNSVEATRSTLLRISGADHTPPFTYVDIVFADGAREVDGAVMTRSVTFSITGCYDEQSPGEGQSGCAISEYAVDGGGFTPFSTPVVLTQPGQHALRWRSRDVAGNVQEMQSFNIRLVAPADQDGDGVLDWYDNCLQVANSDQANGDGDRFGNRCDADFNGNGRVDSQDASLLKSRLGTPASANAALDLNGDGVLDSVDETLLKAMFGKAPGPAGVGVFASGG